MTARTGYLDRDVDAPWEYEPTRHVEPPMLTVGLARPLTAAEVAAARRTVAAHSLDADDCRDLLDLLGIGPAVTVAVAS